jgi:hypothetical protein
MAQAVTAAAAMNVGLMFFMDVSLFPLRPAIESANTVWRKWGSISATSAQPAQKYEAIQSRIRTCAGTKKRHCARAYRQHAAGRSSPHHESDLVSHRFQAKARAVR